MPRRGRTLAAPFFLGAPMTAGRVTVHAPYDRQPIGEIATADATAVEQALARAHALFRNRDAWLPMLRCVLRPRLQHRTGS